MINLLYSLITFFIAFFFIFLGFFGVIIHLSSRMQSLAVSLITENSLLIFLFGLCLLAIGIAMAVNVILNTRRRYFHFKVSGQDVSVDTALMQSYLQAYLKDLFPNNDIPHRLEVKKNHVYITLDLPHIEPSQQKPLLERIQNELSDLFSSYLGYHQHFYLAASFQALSKNLSH